MLQVALTGGLASGKSFIGSTLASLGCFLIQADELGRATLLPNGEAYADTVREFGPGIVDDDGQINRRRLAALVFGNPERLALLSSFVHPPVRKRTMALLAEYAAREPEGIAVVEAAIHIETGGYKDYDRLILAVCSEEEQIERAMRRDGITREEAVARLRQQMPLEEKRKYAHYVIDTSGAKDLTALRTGEVYAELRQLTSL